MAITLSDLKKLSLKAKVGIIVAVLVGIGYFDWFYFLSDAMDKKASLEKKLEEVQSQVKEKEKSVLQFDKFKADVAALKDSYKVALQKLPAQREIPGLFHSISQAGKDAGVEFLLFEPKVAPPKVPDKKPAKAGAPAKPADPKAAAGSKPAPADSKPPPPPEPETFYEEIPVNVTVIGTFQQIVYFFEKVARLSRIVNVSDIAMSDRKEIKGKGYVINTACTIKTYMFVDKKEPVSEKAK